MNKPETSRALLQAALWAAAALAWGGILALWRGAEPAAQYFAGYLVELGLSVDNVFVFLLIFERFRTPPREQSRILRWGVIGAIVMRGLFILGGVSLLRRFPAVLWIFGAFLAYTGFRLLRARGQQDVLPDPSSGPLVRWTQRLGLPAFATILILVETTDLVFALDSLPAVLAVTKSVLVAFTSNLFAVLGLRSLFLVVNGMVPRFRHLKTGLALILLFIGAKMLAEPWFHVSTPLTLGVIGGVLAACFLLEEARAPLGPLQGARPPRAEQAVPEAGHHAVARVAQRARDQRQERGRPPPAGAEAAQRADHPVGPQAVVRAARPVRHEDQAAEVRSWKSAGAKEALSGRPLQRRVPQPARAVAAQEEADEALAQAALAVEKQDRSGWLRRVHGDEASRPPLAPAKEKPGVPQDARR